MSTFLYYTKIFIFNLFIFFLILEILSFLLTISNFIPFNSSPNLYKKIYSNNLSFHKLYNHKNEWGVWRKYNTIGNQKFSCIDVKHKINEIGARDENFNNLNKNNNFILLGDSFAEGFGVEKSETAEYLLEKKLNRKILNFGISYNFGPLQYYLIYKNLAQKYNHDAIIIFFFPQNDFRDNDYEQEKWKSYPYPRPYYLEINTKELEIYIPKISLFTVAKEKVKIFIKDSFWTSNLIRSIQLYRINKSEQKGYIKYSGYYDSTNKNRNANINIIRKFLNEFDKKIYLISIPSKKDIQRNKYDKNLSDELSSIDS